MNQAAISLKAIEKTYPGIEPVRVLKGITADIQAGSITAIMGQSGSGKTTLMNCIGLLDVVDKGHILLSGKDIADKSPDELSRTRNELIGFIFQFHYLLPEFSVLENVLMPTFIKNNRFRATPAEKHTALELLKKVGLADYQSASAMKISGGQQQRVAIARALMNNPTILLADEPTGNLDSVNGAEVMKLFREINREKGTTIILVTHDERIAKQADSIITITDGTITPHH